MIKKARTPEFWEKIKNNPDCENIIKLLKRHYDEASGTDMGVLTFSAYNRYFEDGNRSEYEEIYFDRRKKLAVFAMMSLLYPENKEYLIKLQDVISAVLDEYCWALPAHMKDNIEPDSTLIDLFAAETGVTLCEILFLIGDRLHPLIRKRIKAELERRIINSYLERENEFWWDTTCTNNWASVCSGSVGSVFLYMHPELFERVKPRIDADMERFLSDFYSDGVCREGLMYWTYGFGFFVFYNDLLKQFSDGKYDVFRDEHIKMIAMFHQKCFLENNVTVSFADGTMESGYNIGVMHFLKSVYPEIKIPTEEYAYILDDCSRWFMLSRSFMYYNSEYKEEKTEETVYYMPESQWFIRLSDGFSFAAKGGNNDEPHNHNDIGSFIVVKDGRQVICDLGAGEYTRQYFDSIERYKIFCNSSYSHSVPIIGGEGQKEGKEFSSETDYTDGVFRVDMTKAYDVPVLKSLVRKFSFEDGNIIIRDTVTLEENSEIRERFISLSEPLTEGRRVVIDNLVLEAKDEWQVEITQKEHKTHMSGEVKVYCIDFYKTCENALFELTISEKKE